MCMVFPSAQMFIGRCLGTSMITLYCFKIFVWNSLVRASIIFCGLLATWLKCCGASWVTIRFCDSANSFFKNWGAIWESNNSAWFLASVWTGRFAWLLKWNGCFDSIFISSEGGMCGISSGMYSSTSIRSLNTLRFGRCMLPMTLWRNSAPDGALVGLVLSPTANENNGNSCTIVNTNKTAVRMALLLGFVILFVIAWMKKNNTEQSLSEKSLFCLGRLQKKKKKLKLQKSIYILIYSRSASTLLLIINRDVKWINPSRRLIPFDVSNTWCTERLVM